MKNNLVNNKNWLLMLGFLIIIFWQAYINDQLGHYFLFASIMAIILGIAMSFSKKEREANLKRVLGDLPERAHLIDTPDAGRIIQRKGYIVLIAGIILFIIWSQIYGLSSLSSI